MRVSNRAGSLRCLLLSNGWSTRPTQNKSAWTIKSFRATTHLVAIDRRLTTVVRAGCHIRPRQPCRRCLPLERLAVDQTFNGPQRRSIYPLDLTPYFPAFLLEYPPYCPFGTPTSTPRTTKTERSFPRAGNIHQGQGLSGPVSPGAADTEEGS